MSSNYSYAESLYLLYARINDLEERQRTAPIETEKIRGIISLIDRTLETRTGLSHSEVLYHKLNKYIRLE